MSQLAALRRRLRAGADLNAEDRREVLAAFDQLDQLDRERAEIRAILDRTRDLAPAANDDATAGWGALTRFYRERAARLPYSNERQDLEALLGAGFAISREGLRALRRDYASATWKRPGRRPG